MFESYIGIVQFNFHERSELTSIFTSVFTSESSVKRLWNQEELYKVDS